MDGQELNLQPYVTLLAVILGAWITNRNLNIQKEKESKKLLDNVFEELKDISIELKRSIPVMANTYKSLQGMVIKDITSIKLVKTYDLFVTKKSFEKIYSELNRAQRADIKVLLEMKVFLENKRSMLLKTLYDERGDIRNKTPFELIELSAKVHSYIATLSIAYFYCNQLSENRTNYIHSVEGDNIVFNKVMASLNLDLRI